MLVVDLNRAVDGRVIDDAARERLVGVLSQIEIDSESSGDLRQIAGCGEHMRKTPRSFDATLARGEASLCEKRGRVTVLRRPAGVKRLSHRPEHLAQAGGLRRSQAERPHHLLLVETNQLADTGRGAEDADRAGHVPADVVVRRIDHVAHS